MALTSIFNPSALQMEQLQRDMMECQRREMEKFGNNMLYGNSLQNGSAMSATEAKIKYLQGLEAEKVKGQISRTPDTSVRRKKLLLLEDS